MTIARDSDQPPVQLALPSERRLTFDRLFAGAAARYRSNPAIVAGGSLLSYEEAESWAAGLAGSLRDLLASRIGVADPVVAVALHRSVEFLPALIACWKAGAGFLPIDLDFPDKRVPSIMKDANVAAIITHRYLRRSFRGFGVPVLPVDGAFAIGPGDLPTAARADGIAYVIYTSGSTGKPRGVVVEHRNLVNYVRGVATALGLRPEMRWGAVTSFATDLAYTAIFPPLARGGCVHLIGKELAMNPSELMRYITSWQIDGLKITPSHLAALLAGDSVPLPGSHMVLGGEPLHWSLVDRIAELAPSCTVFNHYGPTETTIGVCTYNTRERPASARESGSVPIGRPLPGVESDVLDEAGRPVLGAGVGELWIGGSAAARGYLHDAELTAQRFVPDPSMPGSNRRRYRSGDIVRRLEDGSLQFVGRNDNQLKIRGHRIEPEEIETIVGSHPDVVACAVVARPGEDGRPPSLQAYVVLGNPDLRLPELRQFVADRLPEHMLPAGWTVMPELPRMASGKVDRKALAVLPPSASPDAVSEGMPADHGDHTVLSDVLSLWREVLGRPAASPDDDFFALGGDSLAAVRLAARLSSLLAQEVPVAMIFMYHSARELVAALAGTTEPAAPVVAESDVA